MPSQVKETETHPNFLPDTSSDFLGEPDSLAGRKSGGRNYLKLVEGRIAYPLRMREPEFIATPLAVSEPPFFKTETILLSDRIRTSQVFTDSLSARKSVSSETYNKLDSATSLIILFADLREVAFVERKPTDGVREGWKLLLEDISSGPTAASFEQEGIVPFELGQATEEARGEGQDVPDRVLSAGIVDILDDLREVADEAREEGFPVPSETAMANSERLIREIYGVSPGPCGVYPTPDGEVAIDVFNGKGSSVILLCDSSGGVLCLVNIKGNRRRAHYSQTDILPDGFVREALIELKL